MVIKHSLKTFGLFIHINPLKHRGIFKVSPGLEGFKVASSRWPRNHYVTITKAGLIDSLKEGIWSSFKEMVHEIISEALLPIMALTFCKYCDKTKQEPEHVNENHKSPWECLF